MTPSACCLTISRRHELAELLRSQALQFGRDDRGKPLAVLGEIDDLTPCRVMRRVGDLARCLFKRNLAHVTTVRQRSSPSGKLPGPGVWLWD